MEKANLFDNKVKRVLDSNISCIEPSRDIFEEAWQSKDSKVGSKYNIFPTSAIKLSVTLILCMAVIISAISLSDSAKALAKEAYNGIRSIFSLEKSGDQYKVIEFKETEKTIDIKTKIVEVDKSNESKIQELLGFKYYLPESLGNEFIRERINFGATLNNLTLKDVDRLSEITLDNPDMDTLYKHFSKFDKTDRITGIYKDNKNISILLSVSAKAPEYLAKSEEVVNIEGIMCKYIKYERALYPMKEVKQQQHNGVYITVGGEDVTKEPTSIVTAGVMQWEYDGKYYNLSSIGGIDIELAKKFAREYLKSQMR